MISSFTATPESIVPGGSSTLTWSVTGADSLSIDQGIGAVTGTSIAVTPSATTTYTLTATNSAGSVTSTATVTVTNTDPIPIPVNPEPLNLNPPDGYVYNGGGKVSTSGTLTLGNNSTIIGVNFTGGNQGLRIKGNGNKIQDCTFGVYSWSSLILTGNDNTIDGCTFNGKYNVGANIQVTGGKRNRITNNVVHGGVTCILFLYSRESNGGGFDSLIEDNVVSGNTCDNYAEEGISFDVHGNSPESTAALEYDRVKSVNGSTVTLSQSGYPSYVGYDMVFLSGDLMRGHTRQIVGQSGSTFTLAGSLSAGAKDEIVIGATFKRNLVQGNTVTAGWTGILLYGLAFGNRIEGNTVYNGGIDVRSLDNLVIASGSATGTYGRAPCGYNTIKNNTVSGKVAMYYYAIPDMYGHANTYPVYTSVGNNFIDNQCTTVLAQEQVCYINGNTGTTDYKNVTLSPEEMIASPYR